MLCCCGGERDSYEDLLRQSYRAAQTQVTIAKSKVDMRNVVKGNRPYVWLLGMPGVGKGAQADRMVQNFRYQHFNLPDLLREEASCNTPRGQHLSMLLKRNIRVPDHVELDILKEAIARQAAFDNKPPAWLFTGYPRTCDEAYMFENEIGRVGLIIYLTADPHHLVRRVAKRDDRSSANLPSVGILSQLRKYDEGARPLLEAYADRVHFADGAQSADKVWIDLQTVLLHFSTDPPQDNRPSRTTQRLGRNEREQLSRTLTSRMRNDSSVMPDHLDPLLTQSAGQPGRTSVFPPGAVYRHSLDDVSRTPSQPRSRSQSVSNKPPWMQEWEEDVAAPPITSASSSEELLPTARRPSMAQVDVPVVRPSTTRRIPRGKKPRRRQSQESKRSSSVSEGEEK